MRYVRQNNDRMNVILVGFMGVGKSTVAWELQRLADLQILEMDRIIEDREGMSIPEIFKIHGEGYFRNAETSLLRDFRSVSNAVISCGGGTVMREENVELLQDIGPIVLLTAKPETILNRVREDTGRPLLEGRKNVEAIRELLEARRPWYEAASDFCVATDGKTAEEIAWEILDRTAPHTEPATFGG